MAHKNNLYQRLTDWYLPTVHGSQGRVSVLCSVNVRPADINGAEGKWRSNLGEVFAKLSISPRIVADLLQLYIYCIYCIVLHYITLLYYTILILYSYYTILILYYTNTILYSYSYYTHTILILYYTHTILYYIY